MIAPAIEKNVSKEIEGIFPGARAVEFSRGSSGLYRLFKILNKRNGAGEVIVPSLCCETVALAALYAGHSVRFADIDPERFCVTPESIQAELGPSTRAVVVVHLFGLCIEASDFKEIREKNPEIFFIEDVAHAAGGRYQSGDEVGSGFDFSMFSFSNQKVLHGDGGVIVSHVDGLVARKLLEMYPTEARSNHTAILTLSLRNLVHSLADLHRAGSKGAARQINPSLWERFRPVVVNNSEFRETAKAICDLRDRFKIRANRFRKFEKYFNKIKRNRFMIPAFSSFETCWRLPLVAEDADLCLLATKAIRSKGYHASNHYFPLHYLFGGKPLPNAEMIGDRILNLWVDESTTNNQIEDIANIINSL